MLMTIPLQKHMAAMVCPAGAASGTLHLPPSRPASAMDRLTEQLQRLYLLPAGSAPGGTRLLVLACRAARWADLADLFEAVQRDLDWPAPALAVSGEADCQLWFSLAEPVPAAEARAGLEALRRTYLPDLPPGEVGLDIGSGGDLPFAVPARQPGSDKWSAFVDPAMAGMFADGPWLEMSPNPDKQADLLAGLKSIPAADFRRAGERLAGGPSPVASSAPACADPRAFLLSVMNDPGVDLRLRIEAAKALLP